MSNDVGQGRFHARASADELAALLNALREHANYTGAHASVDMSTSQNDFDPAGLEHVSVLLVNCTAAANLTGIKPKRPNHRLDIWNVGTATLTLVDSSASSTADNRLALGADVALEPGEGGVAIYHDDTAERWRPVGAPAAAARTKHIDIVEHFLSPINDGSRLVRSADNVTTLQATGLNFYQHRAYWFLLTVQRTSGTTTRAVDARPDAATTNLDGCSSLNNDTTPTQETAWRLPRLGSTAGSSAFASIIVTRIQDRSYRYEMKGSGTVPAGNDEPWEASGVWTSTANMATLDFIAAAAEARMECVYGPVGPAPQGAGLHSGLYVQKIKGGYVVPVGTELDDGVACPD